MTRSQPGFTLHDLDPGNASSGTWGCLLLIHIFDSVCETQPAAQLQSLKNGLSSNEL